MKNVLLKILKEIGIGLAILLVLVAVTVVAFGKQLPFDEEIRSADEYVKANIKEYSVSSSDRISEVNAITVVHEAEGSQIVDAENEVRIQTGKNTPFGSISGATDLPTEKVGQTVAITEEKESSKSDSTNNDNELEFPVTDAAVQKVQEEESKNPADVANSRFNNVQE